MKFVWGLFLSTIVASLLWVSPHKSLASDHDDGETDLKGRSLNLTDLYMFREDNQTGNAADSGNLILIMNSNPRSLPGQQYYFSENAVYDFHISRVAAADKAKKPTGSDDVILRFSFSPNDANQRQSMRIKMIKDGSTIEANKTNGGQDILTTNIADSKQDTLTNNQVSIGGGQITVFAGLREDPFFFDVNQFFKGRAIAAATGTFPGFLAAGEASDFTKNYNVNTIVVRVPISLLQSAASETVFDAWTTISVPN